MRLVRITPAAFALVFGGAASLGAGTDFTARNEHFQPGATLRLTTEKPVATTATHAVRSTPPRLTPAVRPAGEGKLFRRATTTPATAAKRPDVVHITAQPATLNPWKGQPGAFSSREVRRPTTVTRYQDSLAAASQIGLQRRPTVAPTRAVPLDRFAGTADATQRDSRAVQRPAATAIDHQP